MHKLKIRGKDLKKIGYPDGPIAGLAINIISKHYKYHSKKDALQILKEVFEQPEQYMEDEMLGRIASFFVEQEEEIKRQEIALRNDPKEYRIYGSKNIEEGACKQIETAMKLPVTVAGALMPDAHQGYGLPIGGVLATENTVIPYGVGMDIGCRMCLTVYDLRPSYLENNGFKLKNYLKENTRFGKKEFNDPMDDEVLSRSEFKEIPIVKKLKTKAYKQIGSSGSGNHFVEFGIVDITEIDNDLSLPLGQYMGILSHSGSRGLGANIASHYTKIAKEKCLLPREAQNLAWLDLDSEEGMEYWLAMNLAGDYASACHRHIHQRLSRALGEKPIATVENHHNFAWKEKLADGREVIVHRKGATPADKGVLGVIPGSMTAPGFIVKGKGNPSSLNSASHGAGRLMSRTKAKNSITKSGLTKILKDHGVHLIGGGLDEAPIAYKDIHEVMRYQHDLVDVLGTFLPKIVRMDAN